MNNFNFTVVEGTVENLTVRADGGVRLELWTRRDVPGGNSINTRFDVHIKPGNLADNCAKYLRDGARLLVSGTLKRLADEKDTVYIEGREVNFLSPSKV